MRVPAIFPLLSCWPVPSRALRISLACTHACTLRQRIAIPALACSSALHSYLYARACAAAALQLLRSHTPQPSHGALAMVVYLNLSDTVVSLDSVVSLYTKAKPQGQSIWRLQESCAGCKVQGSLRIHSKLIVISVYWEECLRS
jgi:hypothetical protein